MINPSKQQEMLNSPVERASEINNPQFENKQGYFAYDLTHNEFITPRFGEITPVMHLDTVPADRFVINENVKLIRNQINGNLFSTLNQYVDSFYVPLRSVYPTNYEKLIPNPVHGTDLPNSALPQVPLVGFLRSLVTSRIPIKLEYDDNGDTYETFVMERLFGNILEGGASLSSGEQIVFLGRLLMLSTVLSRGQLMDYLGIQFDTNNIPIRESSYLQKCIDEFQKACYDYVVSTTGEMHEVTLDLLSDRINIYGSKFHSVDSLEDYRQKISDIFEAGHFVYFDADPDAYGEILQEPVFNLVDCINSILLHDLNEDLTEEFIYKIDEDSNPFAMGNFMNIGKLLAYQQIVAQYYTNDSVDNVYSSELFMQLLRGVMYPAPEDGNTIVPITREPVYDWNGVQIEYDYISCGGFFMSLIAETFAGTTNRAYVWSTLMLLMRRSLRYGDYFATVRPNLLAVSDQLGINVEGGQVSPIDVTKNLLLQRFLNASNYVGQGFLQYMASMYGVKPSDTGCVPRFLGHRKIELQNQITNNTSTEQGKQTTNLVGYSDSNGIDCFIDDFGYIISLTSFDVLPIYKSGIENTYHFADRFDYFNPMMQNIGDQAVRLSELVGSPDLYENTFGYNMRNSEYKYKLSKAHGAFVNSLPGFLVSYPLKSYASGSDYNSLKISPDFIRDKAIYLDAVLPQQTGTSPAEYYHFICSSLNTVKAARKIQATPPVLF